MVKQCDYIISLRLTLLRYLDENSVIESFRPNCFDLETWLNTFDSALGDLEANYAEFLKRLYSFY